MELSRLTNRQFSGLQQFCIVLKRFSTNPTETKTTKADMQPQNGKPFDSIPGPKSLPIVGTLWQYLPFIGVYAFDDLNRNGLIKMRKYGPLVREEIIPGVPIVWVFTPEDIETVYRCEGRYPKRRSHLGLEKYRLDRPHIYNTGGLLPTNGPEWFRLRSCFQRYLSRIQNVRSFLPQTDETVREFISTRIKPGSIQNFLPELSRLYLELTFMAAFNKRLKSFGNSEMAADSVSTKLIEATWNINSCILGTDNGLQLWKLYKKLSPLYRKLESGHSYLEKVAIEEIELISKEMESNNNCEPSSLIGRYLASEEIDKKDVIGMAVDLLLAGIDTMTYSTSYALYHLARNSESQEKLYKEARKLLPNPGSIVTSETLDNAPYTKAAIKEVFRLNPISVGVGRILEKDAILSGYHVPKGTVVVTQNQVICRLPEYFHNPDDFLPERWLKCSIKNNYSPFVSLPFSHGPRTCIARRLAEQNLQIVILQIIINYKISWLGGELGVKSLLINVPDQDIAIEFSKR